MGSVSDRMRQWMSQQFPLIALGTVLASGLFIGIPATVTFGGTTALSRWIVPVVIVGWAIAMSLFRSPTLAMLGNYTIASQLPQAASLLTLTGALVGAIGSFASQFVLNLGPAIAFAIGSFALLGATALLRYLNPRLQLPDQIVSGASQRPNLPILGLILGTGMGIGLGTILMRRALSSFAPAFNADLLASMFAIAHVLTVVPAGQLAVRFGNRRSMIGGLGAMAGLLCLMVGLPGAAIAITLILGAAFSLVVNGTVPLALSLVPNAQAGLGTGLYFAGTALASSLFGLVASPLSALITTTAGLLAATVLLGAGGCIVLSDRLQKASKS